MKRFKKILVKLIYKITSPIAFKITEIGVKLEKANKLSPENFIIQLGEKLTEKTANLCYKISP